jgi:hypothetical protein
MIGVFMNYLDKFSIVFLDDILIYSKSKEKNEQHLRVVLQVIREDQLYAKLSKCSFYQEHIHYLGHIISKESIAVDLEKIKSIRGWSTLNNVSKSGCFMGLVRYYVRFIIGFYKIVHPITYLRKKRIKFEWTIKCEESFHLLKELLTSAPILKIAYPNENLWYAQMHAKKDLVDSSLKRS